METELAQAGPLILDGEPILSSLRPEHDDLPCPCERIPEMHSLGVHRRRLEAILERRAALASP